MFSDELEKISWEETTKAIYSKTDADVRRALGKSGHLDVNDFMAPYILPIESHFNVEPLVQFLVVEFRELHITQYPLRVRHHEIHLAKVQIGNEIQA